MIWWRFFRQVLGTLLLVHDHDGKSRFEVAPPALHSRQTGVLFFCSLPPIALVGSRPGKSFFAAVAIGCIASDLFTLACYPEEQSVFRANFSGSKRFCRSHISHMLSKILRWVFKRACRTLPVRCRLWW